MGYYRGYENLANRFQDEQQRFSRGTASIDFGITSADQAQFDKSFGHYRDLVLRSLQNDLPRILEQSGGQAGVRGIGGQEAQAYIQNQNALQREGVALNQLSQFGAQQAGQLAQFANTRGQQQLQRNQALWQQMTAPYAALFDAERLKAGERIEKNKSDMTALGGIVGAGASIISGGLF